MRDRRRITGAPALVAAGMLALSPAPAAAAGGTRAAAAACRAPAATALVERFVPADCEACWAGTGEALRRAERALVIDWIVPAGDDAPLAAAALPEAAVRAASHRPEAATRADQARPNAAARAGAGVGAAAWRRTRLAPHDAPRVAIDDGPVWNGYVGLRLVVTRQGGRRAGLRAFAALVERVPAGSSGTALDRLLVRSVAGPFGLDGLDEQRRIEHLFAVAAPEGARSDRLSAVAWVERDDGRVIAAAPARPAGCR